MTLALVGATGSGKTAVSLLLAQALNAEIVSADSVQVYKRLDIGSAKPTIEEQAQAAFHGIDLVEPDQDWTLAQHKEMGERAIADIAARGRTPFVVGGTGLYVRALTSQLGIPAVAPNPEFRHAWQTFALNNGNAALHAHLQTVDPAAAARIHVNDVGRIVRALEVLDATGVPLSEWHRRDRESGHSESDAAIFGLHFADRRVLYERIERRVDDMITAGFADEVRGLLSTGFGPALKSMNTLGYRQICAFLSGEQTLNGAIDEIKRDTRRFARRQLVWFRADPRVQWVNADGKSALELASEITKLRR